MAALQVKDIHKFNKKTAVVLKFSLDDKNIFVNQAALVVFVVATIMISSSAERNWS